MKKLYKGEISLLISTLFFSLESIFVKYASAYFSGIFISLFKFTFGLVFGIIILLVWKKKLVFHNKKYLLLRGLWGAVSMICFYVSIQMTNSGRSILLNNTGPVFAGLFGFLFFKEKINLKIILGLILCVMGTFFIVYDGSSSSLTGDMLGLFSGVAAGFAIQYIKKCSKDNTGIHVYLATCIIGIMVVSYSLNEFKFISSTSIIFLILVSVSVLAAQIMLVYGFKFIAATKGSIIFFLRIPVTLVLSSILLDELININFVIGTLLIISGLLINVIRNKEN
jgi:drug/metabolite transporter (DMT)-like permease